jgi:chromatin assembly factor 1 subunit A
MDVDITPNPNSEDLKSEKDIIEREAIEKLQKSGKPDKLPKKTPIPSGKPNAKISSFFSVVKRQSISPNEVSTEYFQPFFAKPNQRVAPANLFLTPNDKNNSWKHMQSLPESKAKKKCRCVGVDSEPALLVIKLLKFHENHRPAYFGTWRAKSKEITGRRPMVRSEEVDYEFDSDDDWGEDAEILDAESISGSDCDDDEEDVSELNDEDMEANVIAIVIC